PCYFFRASSSTFSHQIWNRLLGFAGSRSDRPRPRCLPFGPGPPFGPPPRELPFPEPPGGGPPPLPPAGGWPLVTPSLAFEIFGRSFGSVTPQRLEQAKYRHSPAGTL